MRRYIGIAFALAVFMVMSGYASAATIIVPDDYPTIQQAVNAASSGDIVYVRAGTYYENVTIGKSLTLQGEDRETTIIDGIGSGPVTYITASYVTISGLTVTNSVNDGIEIVHNYTVHHLIVRDVVVTGNQQHGINLFRSGSPVSHIIEDCVLSNNGVRGLDAHQFSNSVVRNCEMFGNAGAFRVGWGTNSVISNNDVHDNYAGINIDSAQYYIVENNRTYSNAHYGIELSYVARYNTIRDNIIHNNYYGLSISEGTGNVYGNKIYHNDLTENAIQAGYDYDGDNIWDDGYPSGGNYWSDYTGADNYSGVNQDEPGSDGIGDTPYVFVNNQDNYPLMRPWNTVEVVIDIKPGSDPNSINLGSAGVIPVAILSSDTFDATTVNPETVCLAGAMVKLAGKSGKYLAHEEDVNGDDLADLVCQVVTVQFMIEEGESVAVLEAETYDGTPIRGEDTIRIVP